jgi:glycosyltransferase involved in cell wall biosynthesis
VVSNAEEVEAGFRVEMTPDDRGRRTARYGDGYVRLHLTAFAPRAQWHIPWHNPFVTKLAGLAVEVIEDHDIDCVFSWYLEPHGVAGHLAASLTGLPHVVKTAGSDVGRLWHQPGMRCLYDKVFLRADAVVAGGSLPAELAELGVSAERILPNDHSFVPLDEFCPQGVAKSLSLPSTGHGAKPHVIGLYGKLGPFKGGPDLLGALSRCRKDGLPVVLAAMVQGRSKDERKFQDRVDELGLGDAVFRIPFVPPWRVPEFIRACDVVCCLEQDFPIKAHAPVIAQEVMATGVPAILSMEIAAKQPDAHRLAHGFNCWVVKDSSDERELARCIRQAVGVPRSQIGARGRSFVEIVQERCEFPRAYERALEIAVSGEFPPPTQIGRGRRADGLQSLMSRVHGVLMGAIEGNGLDLPKGARDTPEWYHQVIERLPVGDEHRTARLAAGLACQLLSTQLPGKPRPEQALFRARGAVPWDVGQALEYRLSLVEGARCTWYPEDPLVVLGARIDCVEETLLVALPFTTRQSVRLFSLTKDAAAFVALCDGARTVRQVGTAMGNKGDDAADLLGPLVLELFGLGILGNALE